MSREDTPTVSPVSLRRRPSRTVPATIAAVCVTAVGGLLAWAAIARLVDSRWPSFVGWTHRNVGDLTWGSAAAITIAVVLALVGLVLLVSALAPGKPNAFVIDDSDLGSDEVASTELIMTRKAVAKLATAHAHQVSGIDSVSATVTSRAVRLTVSSPSAQRDDLSQRVTAAVREALDAVRLTPAPQVTTTVRTTQP
ncbi:MAG: DUF6286 domain-containing protein [Humibacillus sp.]|nr:DUF6286 domain-containing protein [Humibacillus sp.]MDN5776646.1 DUF6286 domain-containing protein [Humibacillus sp.]